MIARTGFGPFRFAAAAFAITAMGATSLTLLLPDRWAIVGFASMALVGIGSGVSLVRAHGKPAHGFIVALGASTLARLFAAALGALGVTLAGQGAVVPYLIGLAVGYVPLQILEVGWILGRTRTA